MTMELLVFEKASKVYNRTSSTHNKSQTESTSTEAYIKTYTHKHSKSKSLQSKSTEDGI